MNTAFTNHDYIAQLAARKSDKRGTVNRLLLIQEFDDFENDEQRYNTGQHLRFLVAQIIRIDRLVDQWADEHTLESLGLSLKQFGL